MVFKPNDIEEWSHSILFQLFVYFYSSIDKFAIYGQTINTLTELRFQKTDFITKPLNMNHLFL